MDNKNEIPDFLPEELPMTGSERPERNRKDTPPQMMLMGPNGPVDPNSYEGQSFVVAGLIKMLENVLQSHGGTNLEEQLKEEGGALFGTTELAMTLFSEYEKRVKQVFREIYSEALKRSDGNLAKAAFVTKGLLLAISHEAKLEEGKRMVDGLIVMAYPHLKRACTEQDAKDGVNPDTDAQLVRAQRALMNTMRNAMKGSEDGTGCVPTEVWQQLREIMKP